MPKYLSVADETQTLRHKAEEIVSANEQHDSKAISPEETSRLLHELQVHQIELEMQNDELCQIQNKLDDERNNYFNLYDLAPVSYYTLSTEGIILNANLATSTRLGISRNKLIGRPISHYIYKEDQDNYYFYRQKLIQSSEEISCDVRMVRADKTLFWAHLVTVRRENEHHIPEYRVVLYDITEEKKQNDLIARAEREWTDAFDAIQDGVMLHDKENNIMRANQAYKELSGAKKFKEIIGKPYYEVFPKRDGAMDEGIQEHGQFSEEEFTLDNGHIFKSRTYPVFNNAGDYSFGILLFEDITDLRHKENEIVQLNSTLKLISRCNELLVRSTSEKALLTSICTEIISSEKYDFAGVYVKHDQLIKCDYYSFSEQRILQLEEIDFTSDIYRGCPINICINQNNIITINDIDNDPKWSEYLKSHREVCPATPYDMKGSMLILPLTHNTVSLGAVAIYSKSPQLFDNQKSSLFKELSDDMAYGIHTLRLRRNLTELNLDRDKMIIQLHESLEGTVRSIAMMVEARDTYTAGHQNRVAQLAVAIAKEMDLSESKIEGLSLAASIHDLGKIKIPAEILSKPGQLSTIEYLFIQTHPEVGYEILKEVKFPWPIAEIIRQHHEKVDGSGYPSGLKGENILLESRILAVADIVEAMASHRPYRAALGINAALDEIKKGRGVKLDAAVVDVCVSLFEEKHFDFL
ncbi:MAG: HD domain-containing protein [Sulfuricurvum sp.]|jgi:PAS domain S-box-containing protein/putative nucleotidyltransferase with HDIG domain|uniref:HD domain-containing phosphohydrolase n=1 Tax=Sulfuricurvum sp. TaxID=2025608 RepID=UPI0025E0603B|nr:HD domain-containing phosphohydrolase [Sulfuricurvum sp.]MCK9372972.1 HD domain-containing protein [Sulfuricurvum sp.]